MNKKWTKLAAIALILLVIYFGYSRFFKAKNSQPQYQTAQVEKGTLVTSVSASGAVLITNSVDVTSQATGVVADVFVKNGDKVSTGQKILQITQDLAAQAASAQAYNSYLSAKTGLDAVNANLYSLRSKKDTAWKSFYAIATSSEFQNADGSPNQNNRNSSADFQSAQGDWQAAEASFKNQQAVIAQEQQAVNSSYLSYQKTSPTITAPISGIVENITYVPGMVLSNLSTATTTSNVRLAVIKTNGNPIIAINLSEVDISKVQVGQSATVTFDSQTGKTFTGKVASVDKIGTVSNSVTNYSTLIQLDGTNEQILPNMATTASIITNTKDNVLLVPNAAIQNQNGQSFVQVLKNNQPTQTPVTTGESSNTQTEITSGTAEGDTIVTSTQTQSTSTQTQGTSPFSGLGRGFGGAGGGGGAPRVTGGAGGR